MNRACEPDEPRPASPICGDDRRVRFVGTTKCHLRRHMPYGRPSDRAKRKLAYDRRACASFNGATSSTNDVFVNRTELQTYTPSQIEYASWPSANAHPCDLTILWSCDRRDRRYQHGTCTVPYKSVGGAECLRVNGLERKRRAESEAYAKHRLQPKLTLWFLFWNVLQAPSSDRERASLRAAHTRGTVHVPSMYMHCLHNYYSYASIFVR